MVFQMPDKYHFSGPNCTKIVGGRWGELTTLPQTPSLPRFFTLSALNLRASISVHALLLSHFKHWLRTISVKHWSHQQKHTIVKKKNKIKQQLQEQNNRLKKSKKNGTRKKQQQGYTNKNSEKKRDEQRKSAKTENKLQKTTWNMNITQYITVYQ